MAVLGKIRSHGVLLVCVIGFALFAFIAEELVRSTDSVRNESRQQVGEIMGEKISVQDFQEAVDELTDVYKMRYQNDNLPEEALNQVRDEAWQSLVMNKIIEAEAAKVGLTVTKDELNAVLKAGTNQMLLSTPFVNQQTGRFDYAALQKFFAEYKAAQAQGNAEQYKPIMNFWNYTEKTLRQQLLSQKYQTLLGGCLLSNPVSAKMAFDAKNQESTIQLATMAYSTINDKDVKISDADLKAKYEELKERFRLPQEVREIKYVSVKIAASQKDRAVLAKEIAGIKAGLDSVADPTELVRKSGSNVAYLGIPQTAAAFPQDIAAKIDSIATGQVIDMGENKQDNTWNLVKIMSKQQLPDSVQVQAIQFAAQDAAKADSAMNAIKGGADFEAIAKKYQQTGAKTWMTSAQYQNAPSMDNDSRKYIEAINSTAAGDVAKIDMTGGSIVIKVNEKKSDVTKYVAAVVKKPIEFSKDTRTAAYNKFSQFVSSSSDLASLEKNAKANGYTVMEDKNVVTSAHYVAGVRGTREALKWIFDAKVGEVSPLYECGDNDNLLVAVLTRINEKGYATLDNDMVKEAVKAEVLKDKKAEMLIAKLQGVKSVAEAQKKGAKVSTVNQVTFAAPAMVAAGVMEPAVSGAVAATAKGKFCSHPVKGNNGVYVFQVTDRKTLPGKYTYAEAAKLDQQRSYQIAQAFMQELFLKADVTDNRYLFF